MSPPSSLCIQCSPQAAYWPHIFHRCFSLWCMIGWGQNLWCSIQNMPSIWFGENIGGTYVDGCAQPRKKINCHCIPFLRKGWGLGTRLIYMCYSYLMSIMLMVNYNKHSDLNILHQAVFLPLWKWEWWPVRTSRWWQFFRTTHAPRTLQLLWERVSTNYCESHYYCKPILW